jgi:serine/threonine protein kinase
VESSSLIQNTGVQYQRVRMRTRSIIYRINSFLLNATILGVKDLINRLLVVDRHERMRADEMLLHSWILSAGQSKTIHDNEDTKRRLRSRIDFKIKEHAAEGTNS